MKRFLLYWLLAFIFSVSFGEVFLSGIVDGNPTIFQNFIPISIYYLILCLILAWLVFKIGTKISLLIFFVLGLVLESLVWKNINGLDIPAILFFGFLYVFLFGIPLWVTNKIFQKSKKRGKIQ